MAKNTHKVPKKFWDTLTPTGKEIFNSLYSTMRQNQGIFLHPKQEALSAQMWKTVAWNASWLAAEFERDAHHG